MFAVDEATAEAIRRAYEEGGELSGIVEFRRHFPLITDNAKAGECVRLIAGWKPWPDQPSQPARPPRLPRRACRMRSAVGVKFVSGTIARRIRSPPLSSRRGLLLCQ